MSKETLKIETSVKTLEPAEAEEIEKQEKKESFGEKMERQEKEMIDDVLARKGALTEIGTWKWKKKFTSLILAGTIICSTLMANKPAFSAEDVVAGMAAQAGQQIESIIETTEKNEILPQTDLPETPAETMESEKSDYQVNWKDKNEQKNYENVLTEQGLESEEFVKDNSPLTIENKGQEGYVSYKDEAGKIIAEVVTLEAPDLKKIAGVDTEVDKLEAIKVEGQKEIIVLASKGRFIKRWIINDRLGETQADKEQAMQKIAFLFDDIKQRTTI